jgi:hypothetical protein
MMIVTGLSLMSPHFFFARPTPLLPDAMEQPAKKQEASKIIMQPAPPKAKDPHQNLSTLISHATIGHLM